MSFKRLDPEDFILSADSITAALWTTNNPTLNTFFTSSTQEASTTGDYYLSVYQTSSAISGSEVQFDTTYGNKFGSGSALYNALVPENSPTKTIYGQYRALVLGDENANFVFGNVTASDFWAISVSRNRYKESLFPGSLTLRLVGAGGTILLTDDSQYVSTVSFLDSGRVYNLISGSAGVKSTTTATTSDGWSLNSGSYGWFLPDIGTILLNPLALGGSVVGGGISLTSNKTNNSDGQNPQLLFRAISGSGPSLAAFRLNSQETVTSDYVFVRARNSEFNYSENPTFISGSTGEVLYDDFINNPQVYFTTVGMYNDNNELVAVAKLSKPLVKDFTKEALIRVKLDF
jgi:hypothetical protein